MMAVSPKPAPCPLCGKPPHPDHAPFCSRGCKDRDLMQWLGEGYRIPVRETGVDSTETPD
jgi:endogenous inhibitor of DNA gyrase (YacG/DUF329 family)